MWNEITGRQEYEGTAHADTKAIYLRWCKDQTIEAAFTDTDAVDYPALKKLLAAQALISQIVGNAMLGRVMIVNLRPGGYITPHRDEGWYALCYDRFHLSLQSDEGNSFTVEDETVHMQPGDLWWFNHRREHSVKNNSSRDRIHLIIDAVPKDD